MKENLAISDHLFKESGDHGTTVYCGAARWCENFLPSNACCAARFSKPTNPAVHRAVDAIKAGGTVQNTISP
jgi:hypothetical protein